MKKRTLSLALALLLALSLIAIPSLAADTASHTETNMIGGAVSDFNSQPRAEVFRPLITVEGESLLLQSVSLYHFNGGAGAVPGTISIYDNATRSAVGTWPATGRDGNTWWVAAPGVVLEAGKTYYIDCSDRQTWSFGGEDGKTFLYEYTAIPASAAPAPVAEPAPAPVAEPAPAPVAEPAPAPVAEPAPAVSTTGQFPLLYSNSGTGVSDFGTEPRAEVFRPVFGASGTGIVLQALSVYHWNGGAGAAPGTVSIYDAKTNQLVGTWQATGRDGNTWWDVNPNIVLEVRKTYYIDCSDRQTWSFGGGEHRTFEFAAFGYHLPSDVPPIDLGMYSFPTCSVVVNGAPVIWSDRLPYIDINSRSMATLAPIAAALGLTQSWDAARGEITFTDGVDTIVFSVGSNCALTKDGAAIHMDTVAAVRESDPFTPIRCLAEFFGHTVEWGDNYKTVYITD